MITEQDARNKYREITKQYPIKGDTPETLRIHENKFVCECYVSNIIPEMSLTIQDVAETYAKTMKKYNDPAIKG